MAWMAWAKEKLACPQGIEPHCTELKQLMVKYGL